jgi:hypothetical protein
MHFRGEAPSAGLFQARRYERRRSARRRPSLGGPRDPSETSGPRKPRRDSARNMPSTGSEAATETAQTTRPQPRDRRSSTRAIASCLESGGRRRGLETASPESVVPRGLQRCAAALLGGLVRKRSGRAGRSRQGTGRGTGSDRRKRCRDLGHFSRIAAGGGGPSHPSTPVDTLWEANLSCSVARLSSIWLPCRHGSRLPAERSMRPCITGDSMRRPCRTVASDTSPLFPRPETHPGHPTEGPNPA